MIISALHRYLLKHPESRPRSPAKQFVMDTSKVTRAAVEEVERSIAKGENSESFWVYSYVYAGFENHVLE
jgi:hypothetical protein